MTGDVGWGQVYIPSVGILLTARSLGSQSSMAAVTRQVLPQQQHAGTTPSAPWLVSISLQELLNMMLMGVLVAKEMACCMGPCSLAEWNYTLVRRSDALPDGSRRGTAGLCAWWRSPEIRLCFRRQSRNRANRCGSWCCCCK